MPRLERHPTHGLLHLHFRMTSQQLDHQARMSRIEMLDQDERHPDIGGQCVEETAESVEPAGGRAKRNDQKVRLCGQRSQRGVFGYCPRAQPWTHGVASFWS